MSVSTTKWFVAAPLTTVRVAQGTEYSVGYPLMSKKQQTGLKRDAEETVDH
jgi:hypothetical protein